MTTIRTQGYRDILIEIDYEVGMDGRRYLRDMRYVKRGIPLSDAEFRAMDRVTFLKLGMNMSDTMKEHTVNVLDQWHTEKTDRPVGYQK